MDADRLRAAHADAWEEHGRYRASLGRGGFGRLPGIRLMASGLDHPRWNSADVVDPAAVDVDAVRAWYAGHGVPWGVRVPLGVPWSAGRHLFSMRLMGLAPDDFRPVAPPAAVELRRAGPGDVDAVLAVDTVAFQETDEVERPWVEPLLSMPATIGCLAFLDGRPVGCGHCVVTAGDAGPAVYLAGIGVLSAARGRGIGTAMSSWLVEQGLARGARLAHLHPDTDGAARIYAGLGFVEVPGFDIYVDR